MIFTRPYLPLFALGLIHALWGVSFWMLLPFTGYYPALIHARAMSEGFLFSFACGFLMTSLPRFTQSSAAKKEEVMIALMLCLFAGVSDWAALLALGFLAYFTLIRIRNRPLNSLPPFFNYILYGILCGFFGLLVKLLNSYIPISYKPFLHEGMMLFFLIGIGSKILPMLLRLDSPPFIPAVRYSPKIAHILFLTFVLGAFPEVEAPARLLRLIIISFCAFSFWKLHLFPFKKGALAQGIWFSLVSVIFANALLLLKPEWALHSIHLLLINGYSLAIVMVASRVSIAHGGQDVSLEQRSKKVLAVVLLITLAGLTRFSAYFMPERYIHHLGYAALVFTAAILVLLKFLVPIWRSSSQSD